MPPAGIAYDVHESSAFAPMLALDMLLPADAGWGHRRLRGRVLRVELTNLANRNATEFVEMCIDRTLSHSIVPSAILRRLGIAPWGERDFVHADGRTVRRKTGGALLKHGGHITSVNVIFGDEEDVPRIGKLALGALGFALDDIAG